MNGAFLIDEDFLNSVIFDFNGDNHGVILLMVEAVKVIICQDDRRHMAYVVGMGDMVNRLDMVEVFFLVEEVDPPLAKPPEMVLMVPCRGGSAGVMSVRASSGS